MARAKSTIKVAWASISKAIPSAEPWAVIFWHDQNTRFSRPSITSLERVYSGCSFMFRRRNLGINNTSSTYLADILGVSAKRSLAFLGVLPTWVSMLGIHFDLRQIAVFCNVVTNGLNVLRAFFVFDAGPPAKMIQAKWRTSSSSGCLPMICDMRRNVPGHVTDIQNL